MLGLLRSPVIALALLAGGCGTKFVTAEGAGGGGGDVGAGGGSSGSGVCDGFARRQTIVVGAQSAVDRGYSLAVTIDHAAMVDAGARSDGEDLRVFFEDATASRELDRVVEEAGWDSDKTVIWFALSEPIGEGASDDRYSVCAGKADVGDPPEDPTKVFPFWDGFDADEGGWSFHAIDADDAQQGLLDGRLRLVTTSGDIWTMTDSFVFFHREQSGDFVAEAMVTGAGGVLSEDSKVGGIMVRTTTDPGARNQLIAPVSMPARCTSSYRLNDFGTTSEAESMAAGVLPMVIRLERIGDAVKTFASPDLGKTFITIGGTQTFEGLPPNVRVGLTLSTVTRAFAKAPGFVEVEWFRLRHAVSQPPAVGLIEK